MVKVRIRVKIRVSVTFLDSCVPGPHWVFGTRTPSFSLKSHVMFWYNLFVYYIFVWLSLLFAFLYTFLVWIKIVKWTSGLNNPHVYLVVHPPSIGPSVNACQTFSLTYRCTGVPKIDYMVTSQGVRVIYYPWCKNVIQFWSF